MKIHILSGFLGSGKTTAIDQACRLLSEKNSKTGVISNDQGIKLVDAAFFNSRNIAGRQVGNGCFCCNYNELDAALQSLAASEHPDIVFAESVGSCADIVATVIKPLLKYHADATICFSCFADARLLFMLLGGRSLSFDEQVRYIYFKQLEEAGTIVISKIDLMNKAELDELTAIMKEKYPDKILLWQNSLEPAHIMNWLQVSEQNPAAFSLPSLDIDYTVYGAGEACLAWLDQELEIYSNSNNARGNAIDLINRIHQKISDRDLPVGHLKFILDDAIKISFTAAGEEAESDAGKAAGSARLLINARVQTAPGTLAGLVSQAIGETEARSGCRIITSTVSFFQPGYPKPTHRIAD